MSKAWRAAKMETAESANSDIGRESVEVSEAIKALQSQLADLRKIVQAAKVPDDDPTGFRRRQ
jgi:hypothetical protein